MRDVVFALIAIAAGAVFCFSGYLAFRIVIPVWGAFVGFGLGAGLVASLGGDGFLQTGLSWIVGIALGVVFSLLAYLYFEVAVILAMGSIGFALGASLMVALGASWQWLIILVGLGVGILLAIAAIAANLPMVLLIVLSALGGASAITTGLMLLFGSIDTDDFSSEAVSDQVEHQTLWTVLYVVIALVGVVSQLRGVERLSRSMREAWTAERGSTA